MKKIVSMILSLMMICLSVIVFADETSATDWKCQYMYSHKIH